MIKKRVITSVVVLFFLSILLAFGSQIADASKDINYQMVPGNFSELAQKAKPGVINIRAVKTVNGEGPVFRHFFGKPFGKDGPFRDFFGPFPGGGPSRDLKQQSLGSGFVIDKDGFIVTNNHVIERAEQIKVKLADGKEYDAELIGRDPKTDIALIKIEASGDLTALEMGDSDALEVGRWVVAIGSPFGLEQTVTAGIVSAKGRTIGAGPYDDFIQTDASINPGNSGGPLINMDGKVVGINSAIIANGQGIGFAIPVNLARGIIEQLKSGGEVSRGWLGVGIQDISPELAEYYGLKGTKGVLVTHVYEGDPADKAGIKAGDIIVAVNEKELSSSRELSRIIAEAGAGKQTEVSLIRNGVNQNVYVELIRRNDGDPAENKKARETGDFGLQLAALTADLARRTGYSEDERGVIVMDVAQESKAEKAGIRQGDLIKEINHVTVSDLNDYKSQIDKIMKGDTVKVLIKRATSGLLAVKIIK
ncbi:MAG: Do family serine endopeptidase [Deltaproteobacteria bacterium]|nr:Do family serine endopeptidase [Deltaproteobacteria bacterium]